jgi:ComF family protein
MYRWLTDLLLFLFPSNCLLCNSRLTGSSDILCLTCEFRLPRTGYLDRETNPVNMIFWGRVHVACATSLFRFEKGSAYQTLLHELKYRNNRKTGVYLGKMLGQELRDTRFSGCDLIIPVPIHPRKRKQRGYNQSELIARGVSGILGIPVETGLLVRIRHHKSQTGMGRYERHENVKGNFGIHSGRINLSGCRIMLIDDVVTTGATLEACCMVLLERFRCQVFVATVSCA